VSRLLLLLLLPLPALGANPAVGATAFGEACARCHAATQVPAGQKEPHADRHNARPGAGPDLVEALLEKGYDPVRTWIQAPGKAKKDTSCDTRQLAAAQLDDLLAYLMSRVVPEEPPRKERLKAAVAEEQQRAAALGVPTSRARRGGKTQ
jgi:mono/diheme cytochrome c family protein